MPAPERRTPVDIAAAALIGVVVLVAALLIRQHSQARATVSQPASSAPAPIAPATAVPTGLRELWHASDDATVGPPVATGGVVVTADGGRVVGRDPTTGARVWLYQRNMPLCGIHGAWGTVVAVYRDRRGCSQATELDGGTGARIAARNSPADPDVRLTDDGTHILSQGPTRLEIWRSDLVRTLEYGRVDAPVNPHSRPHPDCRILGATPNESVAQVVILLRCPGDSGPRLSIADPTPKDPQKPQEYSSSVLPDTTPGAADPRLLVADGTHIALYLPGRASIPGRIGVYDDSIDTVAQYRPAQPPAPDSRVERIGHNYILWTGSADIALNTNTFAPRWELLDALGPGTAMAQHILVPVDGGIAVLDPDSGAQQQMIPVRRRVSTTGPIETVSLGSTIVEQRGGVLYALGACRRLNGGTPLPRNAASSTDCG